MALSTSKILVFRFRSCRSERSATRHKGLFQPVLLSTCNFEFQFPLFSYKPPYAIEACFRTYHRYNFGKQIRNSHLNLFPNKWRLVPYCFPTAFFHKARNNRGTFAFIILHKQFFELRHFAFGNDQKIEAEEFSLNKKNPWKHWAFKGFMAES